MAVVRGLISCSFFFFFQAEDGIRDLTVTGVQTCALPISGDEELTHGYPSSRPVWAPTATSLDRRTWSRSRPAAAAKASAAGPSGRPAPGEIGRASCRERGEVWVGAVGVKREMKVR